MPDFGSASHDPRFKPGTATSELWRTKEFTPIHTKKIEYYNFGMDILIDVEAARVQIGPLGIAGQWVDFYALLALSLAEQGDAGAAVTADSLSRLGTWRNKRPASVGKEVSRHLHLLERKGLSHIIVSRGKTRSWSLCVAPDSIRFQPNRAAAQAWVDARRRGPVLDTGWIADLETLVGATLALQEGRADHAVSLTDALPSAPVASAPELSAWLDFVRGRAALQNNDDDVLGSLCDAWSGRADAAGKAVGARLRAAIAYRHRFRDPAATLASLVKLATEIELRGDIGSLAVILNVMGLLTLRLGQPEDGISHHLRAAALFAITGDYPMLQAAVFNAALCRREALGRLGSPPDEGVLTLVEVCRSICTKLGVGHDSALAEIAGAEWCLEMGDVARARAYLEAAEELINTLESSYDQAQFREVQALLELADPRGMASPLRHLKAAERLYMEVGDEPSVQRVRQRYWTASAGVHGSERAGSRNR